MDKMFYTLQEVCEKLGKTEDEVREMVSSGQLQEFRDKEELVFRVEQINLLTGVDEEGTPKEYVLGGQEDAVWEAQRGSRGGYRANEGSALGVTNASASLTQELKGLSVDELKAGSDRYKALLEARDLEDVLYGSG